MTVMRKVGPVRSRVTASAERSRKADLYERYACGLFRQALLTTGDEAVAEQVVCDVIAGECTPDPAPEHTQDDTRYRLAESAFRRCQELTAATARQDPWPGQRPAANTPGLADPADVLNRTELGALALVMIGGLGYIRASTVLGISPPDMAALLRSALLRLTTSSGSPGAMGNGGQPGSAAGGP